MSHLLAQRKEIKRLEKLAAKIKEEEAEAKKLEDDLARERAVQEFEAVQMGLDVKLGAGGKVVGREGGKVVVKRDEIVTDGKGGDELRGKKRKFVVDEEELKRIAEEETRRAKRTIEEEKRAKPHLPSFWVPSETPGVNHAAETPQKQHPTCPSSDPTKPHVLSLKALTAVHFTEEKSTETGKLVRTCPSCQKALSNSTKAVLAIPCGHVLCKPCVDKFLTPHQRHHRDAHDDMPEPDTVHCYVCDADLTTLPPGHGDKDGKKQRKGKESGPKPGLVELKTEGTGFAGGGKSMVKKDGVAFQI
jgi:nitric oxide synthase-interacting protein